MHYYSWAIEREEGGLSGILGIGMTCSSTGERKDEKPILKAYKNEEE